MAKANVTVIPAIISMMQGVPLDSMAKRRVAAYARVSTDSSEQENSFDAQVDYYTKKIEEHPDWVQEGIYTDEALSGTSTKWRKGFNQMIEDALAGKIDLIITKSVSRFARNTVDSLQTIRTLKDHNIEVWFEKEGIWTFDGKGELLITIMSSIAQEESRSISTNVTWGKRRSFEEGRVSLPYARFLGYEKGADGKPKIVESEAKVVRLIFDLYLQGKTINAICRYLTEKGILTPGGKEKWGVPTVNSILQQEKYCGNALLQKRYVANYLTKEIRRNNGEIPQFFVQDSHPGIISETVFSLVQEEMAKNREIGKKRRAGQIFSTMVFCGDPKCSGIFGSKTWGSNTPYRRRVWQCNEKYRVKGKANCDTPFVTDDELQKVFVTAFNRIIDDKDAYINAYIPIAETLTDTLAQDSEIASLQKRCTDIYAEIESIIKDNAHRAQNQDSYREKYEQLAVRYEELKSRLTEVETEKQRRILRKEKILRFLDDLRAQDGLMQSFDEPIFRAMTERITVYSKRDISVTFRDGNEVHVDLGV